MEWDGKAGEARFAGGDVLMRVQAYRDAGGYRDEMIAGEDPEMCLRIRQAGWKLLRLGAEMTRHDAAMTRFGQWWTRTVRSGHAYAEGAALHRASPERPWQRECRSSLIWGGLLPGVALLGAPVSAGFSLLLLALPPLQALRIARRRQREYGDAWPDCRAYGVFCMLAKPAQLQGQLRYWRSRLLGRREGLIEYKGAAGAGR
jgi:GT2 family glycosyltransferase